VIRCWRLRKALPIPKNDVLSAQARPTDPRTERASGRRTFVEAQSAPLVSPSLTAGSRSKEREEQSSPPVLSPSGRRLASPVIHEVLRSPGQGLETGIRAMMEPKFGHDFSQVRVHRDGWRRSGRPVEDDQPSDPLQSSANKNCLVSEVFLNMGASKASCQVSSGFAGPNPRLARFRLLGLPPGILSGTLNPH
jgi:hypothetical protein